MIDVVFGILDARLEASEGSGPLGFCEPDFAGGVAGDGEEKVSAAAGEINTDVEAGVGFFEDEFRGSGRAGDTLPDAPRAFGVIEGREVESPAVRCPGGRVVDAGDLAGEVGAAAEIAETERVDLVAIGIGGEGEELTWLKARAK